VKIPHGPAAVREEFSSNYATVFMGRQKKIMILESEHLPIFYAIILREMEGCDLIYDK